MVFNLSYFKNITLLFNGNLYNKDALKNELLSLGYSFEGISDTEVVAMALHKWGTDAIVKFNGFFAIAFFDSSKRSLTLCRDKYGQKPLYYSVFGKGCIFWFNRGNHSLQDMLVKSGRSHI